MTGAVSAAVVAVLLSLLLSMVSVNQFWSVGQFENNYASPWYLVGIGFVALGAVERDWIAVAAGTAHVLALTGYLGASWGTSWLPWEHPTHPGWTDGPQAKALVLASILLLSALIDWAASRRRGNLGAVWTRTVNS
jgi:hypothetical protein